MFDPSRLGKENWNSISDEKVLVSLHFVYLASYSMLRSKAVSSAITLFFYVAFFTSTIQCSENTLKICQADITPGNILLMFTSMQEKKEKHIL